MKIFSKSDISSLWYLLLVMLFFSVADSQTVDIRIDSLRKDMEKFRYQSVVINSANLLRMPGLSQNDSLLILEYKLNAASALNDSVTVTATMNEILDCSQSYTLNPKITSPKIIEKYRAYKVHWLAAHPPAAEIDSGKFIYTMPEPLKPSILLSDLLVPGTGHLFSGSKTKGIVLTTLSGITMGGIIYFTIETNTHRKDYLSANYGADFNKLYNKYNRSYRTRNLLVLGYGVMGLYSLYDLYSDFTKKQSARLSVEPGKYPISVRLSFRL